MITIAGNPVLSAPDGDRLDRALDGVGFMVSIDPYLNETTRHADVILPPPPPSQSRPFRLRAEQPRGAQQRPLFAAGVAARRASRRGGDPVAHRADPLRRRRTTVIRRWSTSRSSRRRWPRRPPIRTSPVAGRPVDELTAMLAAGPGYERRLDMMLRLGPYGDAFGARPDGLTLERLKAAPHGIDLGPLQPRLPRGAADTSRAKSNSRPSRWSPTRRGCATRSTAPDDGFVLIGRRHLRSNNSWMHNVPALAGGTNRCTLQIHPDDAAELGLDGHREDQGTRRRAVAPIEAPMPDAARSGVVTARMGSRPRRTRLGVAAGQPGVNVNQLNDGTQLDPLSGTAVLNGIPVDIAPADWSGQLPDHRHREGDALLSRLERHGLHGRPRHRRRRRDRRRRPRRLGDRNDLAQSQSGQLGVLLGAVLGVVEGAGARILDQSANRPRSSS